MKQQELKKIIFPLATSIMFFSVAVGSTFALFTDKNDVSISLSSGNITSSLEITNVVLYSASPDVDGTLHDEFDNPYSYHELIGNEFTNHGSVTVNDGNLVVNGITPGDMITGKIHVTNLSSINTKYRLSIDVDEDYYLLASALTFSINGIKTEGLGAYKSNWTTVSGRTENAYVQDYNFAIEFPLEKGNLYQNSGVLYGFSVATVQANAYTTGVESYYKIESQMEALAASDINSNSTLATSKSIVSDSPTSSSETVSVSVPEGVKLDEGVKALTLVVSETEDKGTFSIGDDNHLCASYNINVAGVSSDNTVPISVTVPYSSASEPTKVMHMKDNGTVETILPYSSTNPDGFLYAGGYITFKTTSFSNFAVIASNEKIYFAQAWSRVYAYMWKGEEPNVVTNANWPGVEITGKIALNDNGLSQKILFVDPLDYEYVIFNNGGNGSQTVNIPITKGYQYFAEADLDGSGHNKYGQMDYASTFSRIFFTDRFNWDTVKVHLWNDSGLGTTWPGLPMNEFNSNNGYGQKVYTFDLGNYAYEKVIFNNGNGAQTVDLNIEKGHDYYPTNTDSSGHYYCEHTEIIKQYYYEDISSAIAAADSGDTIRLVSNVEISSTFVIGNNKTLTIDLDGHNIYYSGTNSNIFTIESGATLNLIDSSVGVVQYGKWNDSTGKYEVSTSDNGGREFTGGIIYGGVGIYETLQPFVYNLLSGGAIINWGTINIDGVNIAGNSVEGNCGAISNCGGTVNLISGCICDNKASNGSGGAIYNNGGTFNMSGGLIDGNDAYRGAIIVRGAEFNLSGGTISNNTARQYMIDVTPLGDTYGSVNMTGGTVTGNVCNSVGGAFFVRSGCSFTMSGGQITDNVTAHSVAVPNPADTVYNGGAVCLYESAIGSLTGGRITGNIGGGLWLVDRSNNIDFGDEIYIYNNYFDAEQTIRLDVFFDNWRGQCPNLISPLTGSSMLGLYEGHYLGDVDTYGSLLRVKCDFNSSIMDHLTSTRGAVLRYYEPPVVSNVGYWNDGYGYIRQMPA